jgi:YggT family protein
MCSLYQLVQTVLGLYWWVIIIYVIISWLIAFNVINTYNRFVYAIVGVFRKLVEPVLAPIQRIIPSFGGLDLSPIVLLLGLWFVRSLLAEYWGVSACLGALGVR